MKRAAVLALLALGADAAEPADARWATVPACTESGRLEVFPVPRQPGEEVVSLVGVKATHTLGPRAEVRSVSLEWPESHPLAAGGIQGQEPTLDVQGAIRPTPDGRISVSNSLGSGSEGSAGLRNPWETRIRPRKELMESVLVNGGVISGGSSPVALINGHVSWKGTAVDGFEVVLVTSSEAVVSRSGISYVIPFGRTVTIESVRP